MTDNVQAFVLRRHKQNDGLVTVETMTMSATGTPFMIHGVKAQLVIDKKGRHGIVLMPSRRWLCTPTGETIDVFLERLARPAYRRPLERAADQITGVADLNRAARLMNGRHLVAIAAYLIESGQDTAGICLKCGERHDGIEPDAEGGKCEACGSCAVMGAENIVLTYA